VRKSGKWVKAGGEINTSREESIEGSAGKYILEPFKQKSRVSFATEEKLKGDDPHIIKNPDGTMIYSHYRK